MMQKSFFTIVAILVGIGCVIMGTQPSDAENKDANRPAKVLRHVVLFKFKAETTPQQVKAIEDAFRGLPGKIDAILDFEWGTDVSIENKAGGFTHCFFVTFRNEKDRETYLPHPAHKEFVSLVGPQVDKVLVVDYWSGK